MTDQPFPDDYEFADVSEEDLAAAAASGAGSKKPNGHDEGGKAEPPPPPLSTIDWPTMEGRTPPEREFVVDGWLPTGCATSLYAPGGYGKSMLAQILGSCVGAGVPFLGLRTMQAPVLGIFCEDDDDELWRRQCRINDVTSIRMQQLGNFAAQGRLGMPNLLMTFPKGKPPTALQLLGDIEAKACEIGAKLVILDNAAQIFGGEENSRAEVTAFINAMNGLARRLKAAVLMLGHPPKSGAEYSGSTAWHSVVRCMWTLSKAVEKDEEDEGDEPSEVMILTRHKANYAPSGEELRLHWHEGVLRRDEGEAPMSAMDAAFHRHNAKGAFLAALDELTLQQRSTSHSERAGNYAPKAMKVAGLAVDYSKSDLRKAMNALFADQAIVANAQLWRGADRKWVMGLARRAPEAAREPGEEEGREGENSPGFDLNEGAGR
jgi:RecA-family ATPase